MFKVENRSALRLKTQELRGWGFSRVIYQAIQGNVQRLWQGWPQGSRLLHPGEEQGQEGCILQEDQ